MAWARSLLRIQGFKLLPRARLNAVSVEVVNPVIPIVTTKDVNTATVDHGCVTVTRTWRLRAPVRIQLTPVVRREVEAEEIISAISSIVATKDVKVVIERDGRVQTPRTWRMHLILLRLLDLMPGICLFKHVRVGSTDYICAVEQGCIET